MYNVILIIKDSVSGEYLKQVTPREWASSKSEALSTTICVKPLDEDALHEFATKVVTKLIDSDETKDLTFDIEMYDESGVELYASGEVREEALGILTSETLPTEITISVRKLYGTLGDYISSAVVSRLLRVKTGATASAAKDPESSATDCGAETSDSELDALIKAIKAQTKADIVKPKETLSDYVCDDTLRAELDEVRDFFERSDVYLSAGITIPKGILFKGVPGTGKTYAARCIAGSTDCYFMICTASALQGMYVGSGAENIRNVFKGAKALKDASKKGIIIFIDELDSFGSRDSHKGGAGGEEDRTLNQLLAEMSGFEDEEGILILGATNYPERLDDALMRSGRFSRQIVIERPDDISRRNLIEYYFHKIKLGFPVEEFDEICELTKGFTPADIKDMVNESAILTIRRKGASIEMEEVNEAINKVITKDIRKPDKVESLERVTVHECGHVLAEWLYLKSFSTKVTNYAYGTAGGFTQPGVIAEGILTMRRLKGHVMALLGGRIAEEVIYTEPSTGASEDLSRAKKYIRAYYETYHFDRYDPKELDTVVETQLNGWLSELHVAFSEKENLEALNALTDELCANRTLYSSDIAAIISRTHTI